MPLRRLGKLPHAVLGSGFHYCAACKPDGVPQVGSTDPDTITGWWDSDPVANVGIVSGAPSRLLSVDIDVKKGDGFRSWRDWRNQNAERGDLVPDAPFYDTPSGGRQIWFRLPEGIHLKTVTGWLPNVDAELCGGLVVAPPSYREVNRPSFVTGTDEVVEYTELTPYVWADNHAAQLADLPLAPRFMLDQIAERSRRWSYARGGERVEWNGSNSIPGIEWYLEHGLGTRDGVDGRDDDCHRLACKLWRRHWQNPTQIEDIVRRVWEKTPQPVGAEFTWEEARAKIRVARDWVVPQAREEHEFVQRMMGGI